jgi:Zn-dependent peptidase ImmA (M78 family)/DNA-binding XRE family transcriptional regulator
MANVKALIKSELLTWARKLMNLPVEELAKYVGVKEESIIAWENGNKLPTVLQLRKISKKLNLPFAVFYLDKPPEITIPKIKDYRCLVTKSKSKYSSNLNFELFDALEKREIMLELYSELHSEINEFNFKINLKNSTSENSKNLREILGLTINVQTEFKEARKLFNFLRNSFENLGILVMQTSSVSVDEMRGMAIAKYPLPIVLVNRKDSYSARAFTLVHELTHLILHTNSICDISQFKFMSNGYSKDEVFCNKIAGLTLVPEKFLVNDDLVKSNKSYEWDNRVILDLSIKFSVSKEVILRRLLDLNLTTQKFYESKRVEYNEVISNKMRSKGFVPPTTDVISRSGKLYLSTVIDAYNSNIINGNILADYIGIRLKHLNKLVERVSK